MTYFLSLPSHLLVLLPLPQWSSSTKSSPPKTFIRVLGEIDIITLILLFPLLHLLAHHTSDVLDILLSRSERSMRNHHHGLGVSYFSKMS